MSLIGQAKMYGRYAMGLPAFLRRPITLADAEAIVRRGMEERERNIPRLMERGVLSRPQSPYHRLMRPARCEMGGLRRMMQADGLTRTLHSLREAGVYVTFEEFKGRRPIVPRGESCGVKTSDFDNPFSRRSYEGESGGSTGIGTCVGQDLDHLHLQAAH